MSDDNSKTVKEKIKKRDQELKICEIKYKKKTKVKKCRDFALTAVKQNQIAAKHQCGFMPPVWSNDHQKHYEWCIHGNNHNNTADETHKRDLALQKCAQKASQKASANKAEKSAVQYCKIYAQDAINQYNASQQRGCGFFGSGWSLDYNEHYNWCFKTYKKGDLTVIVNEAARRNAMLSNCK